MQYPTVVHWQMVKGIMRYLKGAIHHGLFFQPKGTHSL